MQHQALRAGRILAATSLLFLCAPTHTLGQLRPQLAAVVGPTAAEFTFPVTRKSEWTWNDPATPAGRLEYRWDVTVEASDRRYRIGYFLAKYPGSSPAQGDLDSLLKIGQRSLLVFDGTRGTPDRGVAVRVIPEPDRIRIRVHDQDAIDRVFSSRPASVVLYSRIPGQPADSQVVPVSYVDQVAPSDPGAIAGGQSESLELGDPAPDVELPVLIHGPMGGSASMERLSELRGEVVVLYLWFGTCPVSREEYPELMRFAEKWAPKGVRFRGVVLQDTAEARAWLKEQRGARFPQLAGNQAFQQAYSPNGSPTILVLDRNGRVAHYAYGAGQTAPAMILSHRLRRLTGQESESNAWKSSTGSSSLATPLGGRAGRDGSEPPRPAIGC